MESLKDIDLESLTRLTEDLARYKTSAAKALKRFEIAYNDVMGTGSNISFENDGSSEVPQFETETSELGSLSYTSHNTIRHETSEDIKNPFQKAFNPLYVSQSNRCVHCGFAPLPKVPHATLNNNFKFLNFDKRYWCYSCANSPDDNSITSDYEIYVECHNPILSSNNTNYKTTSNSPTKVTVPKPFSMTIREEDQKYSKELRMKKLKDEMDEKIEKEMKVKIHSNPAPAHIYVPLYKQMMELNLAKKEMRRNKLVEKTKEIVKPFSISNSQLNKSKSMPDLQGKDLQVEGKSYMFKAKPIPKNILSSKINEKLKNKEIIRQTHIHQRAKEMLNNSSLPFSSNKSVKPSSITELKTNKGDNNNKLCIRKKSKMPEESKKIMIDWNAKVKKTVCQKKHNDLPEIINEASHKERYDKFLKDQERSLHHYVRMTQGSQLRESEIRKEMKEKKLNGMNFNVPYKKEIKRQIRKKLNNIVPSDYQKDIEDKLKTYRDSRKQRQLEYEQELAEMQKRIAKQPLLIERQSTTKKSQAEKKDKSTNTDPGNFENDVDNNSSRTLSSGSSLNSENSKSDDDSSSDESD